MPEPLVLGVGETSLSVSSCDSLLLSLSQLPKQYNGPIALDLRPLTFLDPYGLVSLWAASRYLAHMSEQVSILLPNDLRVQAYLERIKFPQAVAGLVQLEPPVLPVQSNPTDSDILLELTPIANANGEDQALDEPITHIVGRIMRIMRTELRSNEQDIAAFANVLSEVCRNVAHSHDQGMVAVQRYVNRTRNTKYLIIGVADLGVGIRASLGERFDTRGWSDHLAIEKALEKDMSRHPDRGLGLYMVRRIVARHRGSLHIHSGDAHLLYRFGQLQPVHTACFPGTQVAIVLSERSTPGVKN